MKLDLPTVTLVSADCYDVKRTISALDICLSKCNFGAVKFFTSLPTDYPHRVECEHMHNLSVYSIWMLKRLHLFIETPHLLVVQHDGWILNPEMWNPEWMNYDYIGPLFMHTHIIQPTSVGSGGFSFRSKKLMDWVSSRLPPWDGPSDTDAYQAKLGSYEDGIISFYFREELTRSGFRFAPPHEAAKFCQGGQPDPEYYVRKPFGFHRNVKVNLETGECEHHDADHIPAGWL